MKMSSNDNAKVSDSGYTNTCENSQSHGSSGSSLSRNSNQSESSGYCDGHLSNFGFRNEALPQPISTKKEKEHKKKKSKTSTTITNDSKPVPEDAGQQTNTGTYSSGSNMSNQTLKKSEVGIVELVDATDSGEHNGDSNSIAPKGGLGSQTNPLDNTGLNANEEFYTVVSLHDGLVVQSTASLQTALGYPKDDWLGCSFIDFIHLKDRPTFAEKLADGIVLSFKNRRKGLNKCQTNLFCNLRRYVEPNVIKNEMDNEIKQIRKKQKTTNNTNNSGATLPYVPFHLSLGFKRFRERRREEEKKMMLLTITAEPVFSAYKAPEETIISSTFSTRHTASCHFSHVDDDVVQYFGYLPQDMVGRSLFDFYHPEDLPFIKDIYETVVRLDGSSFRSKPYRFAVRNGGYVVLETEWSSYINPWERKLEFVVGHHRVLQGPVNPDVFQSPDEGQCSLLTNISEEVFKESQIIQDEIRALLAEKIETSNGMSTYDLVKQSSKLALFMENLMHEVKKPSSPTKALMVSEDRNLPGLRNPLLQEPDNLTAGEISLHHEYCDSRSSKKPSPANKISMVAEERSFSGSCNPLLQERDSVMLGEISPHHEYCDSKSSSETPPSYNQLNYNETMERFFNSKPLLTAVYGSDEEKVQLSVPSNDDSKTRPNRTTSNPTPPNQDSGGSGSGENLSNDSINQTSSGKEDNENETLLNKHNQDMEKLMMLKHKERRSNIKNNKLNKDVRIKTGTQDEQPEQKILQAKTQGYKRKNNNIHGNQSVKVLRYNEKTNNCNTHNVLPTPRNETKVDKVTVNQTSANVNVWPRITLATSHPVAVQSRYSAFSQMIPIYYMPVTQPRNNAVNEASHQTTDQLLSLLSEQQQSFATSYGHTPLAGVIYPPVITPTPAPILYAPPMVVQVPTVPNKNVQKPVPPTTQKLTELKRPASQATSVKAEPGSTMAMSESSKKLFSPGDRFSSCVSVDGGCSSLAGLQATNNNSRRNSQVDSSIEDSSDSSFYGSFFNTSSGSSCCPEQIRANHLSEKIVARSCKGDTINRRRFSMVTELKANFESQTMRGNLSTAQKLIKKRTSPHFNNESQKEAAPMDPPWLQNIKITPELIYRYQMSPKSLNEVLKTDMQALNNLNQPLLVNEQLDQLYLDLELGGFNTKLILDDSNKSSDSEHIRNTENQSNVSSQHRSIQREMEYSKLAMIYEENAPLPMA
ncbi:period circadian protein isoform X3 [Chelonus insularis]|uniref:period circadian protein isoform X3 n=1 Tax=Chelonus insularis TaxID=460826 RepID=UPI00158D53BE|nr:period circadian protein isoform X3 [Chelonus insularis]